MKKNKEKEIQKNRMIYKLAFFVMIFAFLAIVDQVTKYGVTSAFEINETTDNGFINFGNIHNYSTTFLSFIRIKVSSTIIILINFFLFVLFISVAVFSKKKWVVILLAIISAGIFGNMVDRIANGYVIDWVNFPWANNGYFNLADVYIVLGTAALGVVAIHSIWTTDKPIESRKR